MSERASDVNALTLAVLERDRRLKVLQAERATALASRRDAEIRLEDALIRLDALERSTSYRMGRSLLRIAGPFRRIGRRFVDARRRGGVGLGSHLDPRDPDTLRRAYRRSVAYGQPLQTFDNFRRIPSEPSNQDSELDALVRTLRPLRAERPLPLTRAEWDALEAFAADDETVEQPFAALVRYRQAADADPVGRGAPTRFVIDVRCAQLDVPCGIRTHARAVLTRVLERVPDNVRVEALTDAALPPLPAGDFDRIDGLWDPVTLPSVGAYLSLGPFVGSMTAEQLRILMQPGIARTTLWYDALVGRFPHCWLTDAGDFLHYQSHIECLTHFDTFLALSETSADDARLVARSGSEVRVCGSPGNDLPASADVEQRDRRHVVVVGNALPHKNIAAGVIGALPVIAARKDVDRVVVLGNVTDDQMRECEAIAQAFELGPDALQVRRLVDDATQAELIAAAAAVVVPSLSEGLSLPVLEALHLGTPVVVSEIAAHRELLGPGTWWFDPRDPATLAGPLSWVIEHRQAALVGQRDDLGAERPAEFAKAIFCATDELVAGLEEEAPRVPMPRLARPTLSLSKICEVEDFETTRLRDVIRDVFSHEVARFGSEFPTGREYRKYWEVAMAVLAFRDAGLLDGTRRFLGVGAGNEPTLFYLTRFAGEVIATDLYESDAWAESANASMLEDPGFHWPFAWDHTRLTVRDMDALALDLPDASVDGVFSSSSIEHFGDRDDVRQSLDEAYRVLAPGGVLSISTEYRLAGDRPGIPGVLLFDEDDIRDVFLGGRDWELMEPFDANVSPATLDTLSSFNTVAEDQNRQVDELGGLWTHQITYARYPHIVLRLGEFDWTSFHIALRKPS